MHHLHRARFSVAHHHRRGHVEAEDTLKTKLLCNCRREISLFAAEGTQVIEGLCTCANLPDTCQKEQHTQVEQKVL